MKPMLPPNNANSRRVAIALTLTAAFLFVAKPLAGQGLGLRIAPEAGDFLV
jgi:hypothetical protein